MLFYFSYHDVQVASGDLCIYHPVSISGLVVRSFGNWEIYLFYGRRFGLDLCFLGLIPSIFPPGYILASFEAKLILMIHLSAGKK